MAYRSEAGRIGNKQNYTDLNLTHYPNTKDTRVNNINMKGFVNVGEVEIPDYIMAEYVNAALDGVMALERALGTTPMVSYNTPPAQTPTVIENRSVADRLNDLENGYFDERYGGAGWEYTPTRPTLSSHSHDGQNGHPGKIDLQKEVESLLQKRHIDLTAETGLTGADIFVAKTNPKTIANALEEYLSKVTGGIVQGPTEFRAGFRTRTLIELTANEFTQTSNTTSVSDNTTTTGVAIQSNGNALAVFHTEQLASNLLYGRYAVGVRAKVSELVDANVLRITIGNQVLHLKGTDFNAINTYQNVYFVFNHTTTETLKVERVSTATALSVSVDNLFVHPVHPAIFDK